MRIKTRSIELFCSVFQNILCIKVVFKGSVTNKYITFNSTAWDQEKQFLKPIIAGIKIYYFLIRSHRDLNSDRRIQSHEC